MASNYFDNIIVWEWLNDYFRWNPYPAHIVQFIEANHKTTQRCYLKNADPEYSLYKIDFCTNKQVREINGRDVSFRDIRRKLHPPTSLPAKGIQWQWESDNGRKWHQFDEQVAELLEQSYASRRVKVDLSVYPYSMPYIISLITMTQTRIGTGRARPVRRNISEIKYPLADKESETEIASTVSVKTEMPENPFIVTNTCKNSGHAESIVTSVSTKNDIVGDVLTNETESRCNPSEDVEIVTTCTIDNELETTTKCTVKRKGKQSLCKNESFRKKNKSSKNEDWASKCDIQSHDLLDQGRKMTTESNSIDVVNPEPEVAYRDSDSASINDDISSLPHKTHASNDENTKFAGYGSLGECISAGTSTDKVMTIEKIDRSCNSVSVDTGCSEENEIETICGSDCGDMKHELLNENSLVTIKTEPSCDSEQPSSGSHLDFDRANEGCGATTRFHKFKRPIVKVEAGKRRNKAMDDGVMSGVKSEGQIEDILPLIQGQVIKVKNSATQLNRKIKGHTVNSVLSCHTTTVETPPVDKDCCICCHSLTKPSIYAVSDQACGVVKFTRCSHIYHRACLCQLHISTKCKGYITCSECKEIYGEKIGVCPPGVMQIEVLDHSLPGHSDCSTLCVMYYIKDGKQGPEHPNPGYKYTATAFPRIAYLPNNDDGKLVLLMLVVAWKRRLTFTIGTSTTSGVTDTVTWNDIHHKTECGLAAGVYGYPDTDYLTNVKVELAGHGVTPVDIQALSLSDFIT